MKSYTPKEVEIFLNLLLSKQGDTLLLHSALGNLGKITNEDLGKIPQIWLEILTAQITQTKSTLLMPSFNYNFPLSHFEDLREQKSEVGILTEDFRKIASFRSNHPMFSFCALGENAKTLICPDKVEFNPFLQESLYHRLFLQNTLMVFLGIDIRVCTFMVYVEAMCGVKYRYFKPFFGEIISQSGVAFKGDFYHFCLPRCETLKVDYSCINKKLLAHNIIKVFSLGGGLVYAFRARDFFDFVAGELRLSPFILLESPPHFYYHFEEGQEKQILI